MIFDIAGKRGRLQNKVPENNTPPQKKKLQIIVDKQNKSVYTGIVADAVTALGK